MNTNCMMNEQCEQNEPGAAESLEDGVLAEISGGAPLPIDEIIDWIDELLH